MSARLDADCPSTPGWQRRCSGARVRVARLGQSVLFYDDVEDEFAVATVDADEIIRDWSLWGSLDFGLKNFPRAGPVRGPVAAGGLGCPELMYGCH